MSSFIYQKHLMAQALAIVAEGGLEGMHYNGLVTRWVNEPRRIYSKRFRISPFEAHRFSGAEFEQYMILAWRMGLVGRSKYKEWNATGAPSPSYQVEDEVVWLTPQGWEFMEQHFAPALQRWSKNISDNLPTIAASVFSVVIIYFLTR